MASSIMQELLQKIEQNFQCTLKSNGVLEDMKFKNVLKKTRDLKSGDLIIPAGSIKLEKTQATEILASLTKLLVHDLTLIRSIAADKFSFLAFFLDRSKIFKAVFNEISRLGPNYGYRTPNKESIIVHIVTDGHSASYTTLKDLRQCIVQSHLIRLLEANGYTVTYNYGVLELSKILEITESCSPIEHDVTETICSELENLSASNSQFTEALRKFGLSAEKLKGLNTVSDDVEPNGPGATQGLPTNFTLDLKQFILDKGLCIGKDGYSKNINSIKLIEDGTPTPIFQDVLTQTEEITRAASLKPACGCLHVVPHNQTYRQQQIQLIRLALFNIEIPESQLIVGPVTHKGKTDKENMKEEARNFYRARYGQMKEASEMRYGRNINASELARRVQLLTCASVKVDLLGNDAHNELQLDISGSERQAESRLGSFILYNTARLSALINQFENKVSKGYYPPLPPVDEVDFSLLREEEDWELLFLFIAEFPSLVKQTVDNIFPTGGKCLARIHTHKVTKFLASFCKCLSAHYSRYHVLSGSEQHLLPLMFARLHLMKSALQVLLNCLHLLDIEALSEL